MKKIQVTLRTTVEYRIIIIMEENKDQLAGIGKFHFQPFSFHFKPKYSTYQLMNILSLK